MRAGGGEAPGRSALSRHVILEAARDLFSEQGYTATSMSDIVGRAGTSVGLPYYHFGSKKDIFLTLWNEYQDAQEETTRAAVAAARQTGATGKEQMLAGTAAYMYGAWRARRILPMVHGRDTPAGFDAAVREADRRWQGQNQALLAEYDPNLVRTVAILLGGGLRAVCLELAGCRSEAQADRLTADALVVFGGLLAAL